MTYKQIQGEYPMIYPKTIKSCWIADVKRDLKLAKRIAYNRIDFNSAKYPCPNIEIKDRIKRKILQSSF